MWSFVSSTFIVFTVIYDVLTPIHGQGRRSSTDACMSDVAQKSCGACISSSAGCAWCRKENYDKPRCDQKEVHIRPGRCGDGFTVSPVGRVFLVKNVNVQDGDLPEQAIQMQPQNVSIRIRPGETVRVEVKFRQAQNYPVDLYYIMDLSQSMFDDKESLARLGDTIAERMSAITRNFRLGFGSFVDKLVMPFVITKPAKDQGFLSGNGFHALATNKSLLNPCLSKPDAVCAPPYGFKNHMSLDLDTSRFAEQVNSAEVSGNLDAPEGGFDAIMQSVVCDEVIGWRNVSRRMLLFSTDAGFHYAGDGKLGGIVIPNDGECHMENNVYTESSNLDYPSVSQITAKLRQKSVSIIFAVTKDQFHIYEKLAQIIESASTGELAQDSSNIVDLIEDNYNKIASFVHMKSENVGKSTTVKFFSRCFGEDEMETDRCDELKIGENVTFYAEISVSECPRHGADWRQVFSVYPAGLSERLYVELELVCQCDCEKPPYQDVRSEKCFYGNGTFECGVCACNEGRFGENCECDETDVTNTESETKCFGNQSRACSGVGRCECGRCRCDPGYSGPFCDCDNLSCDRTKDGLCGGPERGSCECGTCSCLSGFSGPTCSCPTSNQSCIGAKGLECSGHGDCVCNRCQCDEQYMGPTCNDCPTCPGRRCEENRPCVECVAYNTGPYSVRQCDQLCRPDLIDVQTELPYGPEVARCQYRDDNDCVYFFSYQYLPDEDDVKIVLKEEKSCPQPVDVVAIVAGVVATVVAVGLVALLIWRLFTFIHDTREVARFEKERRNAKWDTGGNPIYKKATSTFQNPTYTGKLL